MEKCPICKQKMEDKRHVMVECFYEVHEVVPDAKTELIFTEVPLKGNYWGTTRTYTKGTKDKLVFGKPIIDKAGRRITKCHVKQIPVRKIRLLEQQGYSISCCKDCRSSFLNLLKEWRKGRFIFNKGEGNIPIRENGTIKYITEKEWYERKKKVPIN